jgi:ubiquinone/menaquinone biosynthesis C-methylase UbiE
MSANERERQRILEEYQRRARELDPDLYSDTRPVNLFLHQGQQRALLEALERSGLLPLRTKRILEIGCGTGRWLRAFGVFGAESANLAGIDLDGARVEDARRKASAADLRIGDATQLPWPDGTFDIVFQSLVFTSILDAATRKAVAGEMQRMLRRGGAILWYDFRYNNPANTSVRKVTASEIRELFPDHDVELSRVSLAPPIARRLVHRSWFLASALEKLQVLNTHYFAVIRPCS